MKNESGKILVVDDEPDLLTLYELALLREGHQVQTAGNVTQARQALADGRFDLLVTDMRLPDGLGLDLVIDLQQQHRAERSVVITAYGSAENAVQALKAGAFDYLTKPVDLQRFRAVVRDALASAQHLPVASVAAELPSKKQASSPPPNLTPNSKGRQALALLVGESTPMQVLRARAQKVALSMAPVLLQGESGTGKELVARAVHACSHRWREPFVAVNCGAIPENLLEAEFFGAKKGAYTGLQHDRDGFFVAATGGTLFLDEIGDLPVMMQSKLLRVIQERCVRPLGSTTEVSVDVRVVSASHKVLSQEVAAGRFRQDLFYRLNVIELTLPPLRERKQDLPQLAQVLMARIAQSSGQVLVPSLSELAQAQLAAHDFPGNVRELENILHRAMALSDGPVLELDLVLTVPQSLAAQTPELDAANQAGQSSAIPSDLQAHLDRQEREILLQVLRQTDYNRTLAAQRLGISLRQIRYRMDRLDIPVPDTKREAGDTLSPREME